MDEKKVREAAEYFIKSKIFIKSQQRRNYNGNLIPDKKIDEVIGFYKVAIEALEKQLPKKIADRSLVKDNGAVVCFIGRCPSCNEIIDATTTVCDCGQRLDWSE